MKDQRKIILIIEDEQPMSTVLTDSLGESGYITIQAKNGQEGLILALQRHPDLILLDLLMPKMDGLTMIGRLRQNTWGKRVPVIILTNMNPDSDETLQAIIKDQPSYYLIKSDTKLDEIVSRVREVLSHPSSDNKQ